MRLKLTENSLELLRYIVERGPKTLYAIKKEKGMALSSAGSAFKSLKENNLVELQPESNQKTKHPFAKPYVPTFKGFLVFLSNYSLKPPTIQLPSDYEDSEEFIKKFMEKRRRERNNFKNQIEKLKGILKENQSLNYPLFNQSSLLEPVCPGLYEVFVQMAKELVTVFPFELAATDKRLKRQKARLRKELKTFHRFLREKPEELKMATDFGVEPPFDPVKAIKRELDGIILIQKTVHAVENRKLRESFFHGFLARYGYVEFPPNQELHDYTLKLLNRKKKELELLEKALTSF